MAGMSHVVHLLTSLCYAQTGRKAWLTSTHLSRKCMYGLNLTWIGACYNWSRDYLYSASYAFGYPKSSSVNNKDYEPMLAISSKATWSIVTSVCETHTTCIYHRDICQQFRLCTPRRFVLDQLTIQNKRNGYVLRDDRPTWCKSSIYVSGSWRLYLSTIKVNKLS